MKQIRTAIYSKLTGDSTLTAMLAGTTSVYYGVAPQGSAFPLVVFTHQAGRDAYTFAERSWRDHLWLVKGVAQTASAADDIAERIDAVLTDGALSVSDAEQLYLRREGEVAYLERDGDVLYRHSGGNFRLWTRET